MPNIGFQVRVPATPGQVFEHLTSYPVAGHPSRRVLEDKYGKLLEQDGQDYTFQDDTNEELRWQCTFEPPRQRVMRILESNWADRLDFFESSEDGTIWTVVWELKTQGFRAYTQWLTFQLTGKRRTYEQIVAPVLRHFSQAEGAPPDSTGPNPELRAQATEEIRSGEAPTEEAASTEPAEAPNPEPPVTPRGPRPHVRRRRRS